MKIKYHIPTVGDGNNAITSSHLLRIEEKNKYMFRRMYNMRATRVKDGGAAMFEEKNNIQYNKNFGTQRTHRFTFNARNLNRRGEYEIHVSRVVAHQGVQGGDPVLFNLSRSINSYLFPHKEHDDKRNFMNTISFKYIDGQTKLFYGRTNNKYYINGLPRNKADVITAIGKIILRASLTKSSTQLYQYMRRVTLFPHNVLYALENRTPYHFRHEMIKAEVVINTRLISDDECALEISDGVWGAMTTKELNTFIDYFKYNKRRSKKWTVGVTNEYLWQQVMNRDPTRTELSKMTQWLLQHRTSELIEDRATKLLFDIAAETPQIDFVQFRNPKNKALFVNGKYSDWVIVYTGSGMKRGTQDVATYQITGKSKGKGNWHGMQLSGSICIDNVSRGVSIGDQLTARALALVDERIAAHHLYTIKPLITPTLISGETILPRLDRSKLNHWNQFKAEEWNKMKKAEKQ